MRKILCTSLALAMLMTGSLFAIAKDVKVQVEFNPAKVGAYRLIGYENRRLADEDFNNDKKDAGEIGVGHTVTALYEIVPKGKEKNIPSVDPLKYQQVKESFAAGSDELLTVKLRYKLPESESSTLMSQAVIDNDLALKDTSKDFRFASSVVGYGMLLQKSAYKGEMDYEKVLSLAKAGRGADLDGYRAEFIRLVEHSELLAQ